MKACSSATARSGPTKLGILAEAGVTGAAAAQAVNRLLNQEMRAAIARGLSVLYCIGEKSEEQDAWQEVLGAQLDTGPRGGEQRARCHRL